MLNKLGNDQEANDVISKALLLMEENPEQYRRLFQQFKILQCKVLQKLLDSDDVILKLNETYELLLKELGYENDNLLKKEISRLCFQLGSIYDNLRDFEYASKWLKKSTEFDTANHQSILLLANVLAKNNEISAAQAHLSSLIQGENNSDEASMIMAQLLCQQHSFSVAAFHYRELVMKSPSNFNALEQFLEASRRIDQMEESESIFKLVENINPQAKLEPGYIFCQGIFLR